MDVGYPAGPLITAVGLSGLLVSEYFDNRIGRWIFKPWASTGFLVTALTSPALDTSFGRAITGSLLLSMLGDILLIPDSQATFQAGLFSFLLAHLGFGYAFARRGLDQSIFLAGAAGNAVLGGLSWKWLSGYLRRTEDKVSVPLYSAVIAGMSALAIGSAWNTPHPEAQIAGAVIFQLSDLCVAREQFVAKTVWNPIVGLPLYYLAQQLLASLLWY